MTADEARKIWDEIEELEEYNDKNAFIHYMWQKENLMEFYNGCPDFESKINYLFLRFWNEIWPVFIGEIKKEIQLQSIAA